MISVVIMAAAAGLNLGVWLEFGSPISAGMSLFCTLVALGWVAVAGGQAVRR